MPFSDAAITSVARPSWRAGQWYLRWTSSAPAGTWFQVYVARRLAWYGQSTSCTIAAPSGPARVNVGTVADGEQRTDFSASLPVAPDDRARLEWLGGRYEGADLAAYRIYGEHAPGAGIDYTKPLAEVAAFPGGFFDDGWGKGGWGQGGWGFAAGTYSWTSGKLASGVWSFAVKPVDAAGNEGPGVVGSVAIVVPPLPPALFSDFERLHYTYDPSTKRVTLLWRPSPG